MSTVFFLKQDHFHKIFTTLEKKPKNTNLRISIESGNHFFVNTRRSKQINQLLESRQIKATFIAQNTEQARFFEDNNLNYELKTESKWSLIAKLFYYFVTNIKKYHLYTTYQNHTYRLYIMIAIEVLAILSIAYGIRSIIIPKTTITLTPSYDLNEIVYNFRYMYPEQLAEYPYQDKYIIIPMYTGSVKNVSSSLSLDKTHNEEIPIIKGKVRIINTTYTPYSLKAQTQLVDDFGIEYTIDNKVTIPAAKNKNSAGMTYVSVTSKNTPENIELIKQHQTQITLGHHMLIKNLKSSRYTKKVYAEAIDGFEMVTSTLPEVILLQEIGNLQKELYSMLDQQKKELIQSSHIPDGGVVLPFTNLMQLDQCDFKAHGDTSNINDLRIFSGTLQCNINFIYVKKDDIINGIKTYIANRSTETKKLITIQNNFITFFDILTGQHQEYIIPTKINIIESYNLHTDTNHIIESIKNQALGKSTEEVIRLLQGFPEIEKGEISISPFRETTITNVKSRIRIKIQEQAHYN